VLAATLLRGPDQVSVQQCVNQTGMSANDCGMLLIEIQAQPSVFYLIAKAALLKYGAKTCSEYVQAQTGVPKKIGFVACDFAIRKIWEASAKAMLYGGPEWKSLYAGGGYNGIHWRPCTSPLDLQPGEHFDKRNNRCVLNVAILQKKGEPKVVVYVPCAHLPNDPSNYACIDKDGVSRPTGSKQPVMSSGWFGKRLSNWWPSQFEQTPWKSPTAQTTTAQTTADRLRALAPIMSTTTATKLAPPTRVAPYPTGTVATRIDSKWLVAVPKSALSGEGDYIVVESTTDPEKRGAKIVRPWLFEYMTGKRSWYETPPAWAGFGALGLGLVGGAWLYKRKRA
jgi:hypothetical protein